MYHKTEYASTVYRIESVSELIELEMRLPSIRLASRKAVMRHLVTDYSGYPGVIHLGFTPINPILMITPAFDLQAHVDLLIVCKEGCIIRDEALGHEFIPNQQQIREAAAAIRQWNNATGLIRNADTVGFDVERTYKAPTLAFAG